MSDLKINSKFAEKYEKYRQKEELQRLKDRYGDQDQENSSDSSDSDSDESEVELDPKLDRDFYRTLSLLKKKDPKIYQKDAKFYTEDTSGSGSDDQPSTSKKSEKPMFLKDYERKVVLERGGKYDDDEDDSADEEVSRKMQERAASPTYIQEQKELQESFRKFVRDSDDGDSDGDGQLLTRRTKTQEEKDKEEADYVEWLKGQAELEGEEEVKDMKYLRDYWNNPELDEKESFLRDYMLKKGYLEEDEEDRIPTYNEMMQDDVDDSEEEGESFLHKQEDFERHYNFRFEEPDAGKIKTYPRNIATSVRSKDDRRKMKREEVKERKKKEKEQKQQQLKELKNLKRAEIMDKLKKLQELTGNEKLAFNDVDLEGDFDPQQHDQLMQKFFGDEYYGENEEEKPQFDDDDDLAENWNWDTWVGKEENEDEYGDEEDYAAEEDYEPNFGDPDFIMDADYDPSQQPVSKKKRKKEREQRKKKTKEDAPLMGKKRKKSHFAEIITKNKPVFDPKEKTFEQYLDEYYKLDYEDIIDDLPCRFRYREVVQNDFGLTADEILKADESELNRWCSLRKTCMYRSEREELCDVKNFQIKARNNKKKQQVFVSLYNEDEGQEELMEPKGKVGKKRRDRLKRSEVKMEKQDLSEDTSESPVVDGIDQTDVQDLKEVAVQDEGEDDEEFLVPKKKKKLEETAVTPNEEVAKERTEKPQWLKKKMRHRGGRLLSRSMTVKMAGREFSRQRLQAYGLNPKRLHFRELYRQKRKEREKKEKQQKKSKPSC
ncbi:protein KRI1 homolog isoform X2 [Sinocyclocheilus anshuiensis]|uniref:Protein KRI1 homolog n=1 Tax=Sinocyclocheilus anshuiensis TaxID=1608454 RepID=A0A671S624_9TELE|nr:PREDICTED: protein KRI1 homolog isoform X2 [Sinocyclocheilus anshuiensis]